MGWGGAGGGSWVAAGASLDIYPEAIKDSSGRKNNRKNILSASLGSLGLE